MPYKARSVTRWHDEGDDEGPVTAEERISRGQDPVYTEDVRREYLKEVGGCRVRSEDAVNGSVSQWNKTISPPYVRRPTPPSDMRDLALLCKTRL